MVRILNEKTSSESEVVSNVVTDETVLIRKKKNSKNADGICFKFDEKKSDKNKKTIKGSKNDLSIKFRRSIYGNG